MPSEPDIDTDFIKKRTINWFVTFGSAVASFMICVGCFQFFVPAKAEVEDNSKDIIAIQVRMQADEQKQLADHELLMQINYKITEVYDWVEQQRDMYGKSPRQKGTLP